MFSPYLLILIATLKANLYFLGSTNAQRVKTNLTIRVETVSYDVEAMSLALKVFTVRLPILYITSDFHNYQFSSVARF